MEGRGGGLLYGVCVCMCVCVCVCVCLIEREMLLTLPPQAVQEYQPYKDYELPPTYQGDFHGNRREERNRFLLQVLLTLSELNY